MENKATGYICVFRSLKSHWLWHDATKLKWWLDILLSANYTDRKVLIKNKLLVCNRGESIKSMGTWAKEWRTTRNTVKAFFDLLSADGMITYKTDRNTTHITICNYDSYNTSATTDKATNSPQTKQQTRHRLSTNNKDNKDNKENKEDIDIWLQEKKDIFKKMVAPFVDKYGKELCNDFWYYWVQPHKTLKQVKWEGEKYFDIDARLRTFKKNAIKQY